MSSGNDDEFEAETVHKQKSSYLRVDDSHRIRRDMSSIWTGQSLEATTTKNVIANIVYRQKEIISWTMYTLKRQKSCNLSRTKEKKEKNRSFAEKIYVLLDSFVVF